MNIDKLATLKLITFTQTKALAAEKGAVLTRESEMKFRNNGGHTNAITSYWYKLSTVPGQQFSCLTDVRDFLLNSNDPLT